MRLWRARSLWQAQGRNAGARRTGAGDDPMRSSLPAVTALAAAMLAAAPLTSPPALAAPPDDACALLTAAQVTSAVGVSVGAGTYVTPTFKKTCTFTGPHMIVTLFLESPIMYDAGKRTPGAATADGVGDEAYYMGVGSTVSVVAKKGDTAFKVSVYAAEVPLDRRKVMEMTLAKQVLAKL